MKSTIHKILVCRPRFMGDVLLTTPFLQVLRENLPQAHIGYLTESRYAPILRNNPHVDCVFFYPDNKSVHNQLSFINQIKREQFDVYFDLWGSVRTAFFGFLAGIPKRVGRHFRVRRWFYTHILESKKQKLPAPQFYLEYLEAVNITKKRFEAPQIFLLTEEKQWARTYFQAQGVNFERALVGLQPGASWPNKIWPEQKFVQLANQLLAHGYQVLVTWGPGEEDLARSIISKVTGTVFELPPKPLRQLAAALSCLQILISNDCGTMHLAVAAGTTTIGLFGATEPEIWFPYPAPHQAIYAPVPCRPCHKNYCPLGTLECLQSIEVDRVFKAVQKVIAESVCV